jgi:hypothetical protein
MPISNRRAALVLPALAAVTLTLSACGSDSPAAAKPLTAAQLAAHYDSLASALGSGSTAADTSLGQDVELFNGVIADGILPSQVTVTVGGQQQSWYGNFANWIFNNGQDSLQVGLLWKDTQADAFLGFILVNANSINDAGITARGGDYLSDSADTYTASFAEAAGLCSYTAITNIEDSFFLGAFATYGNTSGNTTCNPATATIAGSFYSASGDTTVSAALQSITISTQTINGVRLVTTYEAAQQVVHALQTKGLAHGGAVFFRRR